MCCHLWLTLRGVLLRRRLMTQLAADCALLEELRVMDYSLLLGIHSRSSGWTSSPHATDRVSACVGSLPHIVQGINPESGLGMSCSGPCGRIWGRLMFHRKSHSLSTAAAQLCV